MGYARTGRAPLGETVTFVDMVDAARRACSPEGTAATCGASKLHGPGTRTMDLARRPAPRGRWMRRVVGRLSNGFTGRVQRWASQIGLPPGAG